MATMAKTLISPLAVDLALSRVAMAALKAKEKMEVPPEDRCIAGLLSDVFSRELENLTPISGLSNEVVPSDSMRTQLELTLSTMPTFVKGNIRHDTQLMSKLLPLLNAFSNSELEEDRTDEMISVLLRLSEPEEADSQAPANAI